MALIHCRQCNSLASIDVQFCQDCDASAQFHKGMRWLWRLLAIIVLVFWIASCSKTDSQSVTPQISKSSALKSGTGEEKISSVNALLNVKFDAKFAGSGLKTSMMVSTNLPKNTRLMCYVGSPKNSGGMGFVFGSECSVSDNQVIEFGPLLESGKPLRPGHYKMTMSTLPASLQPKDVQVVIGPNGENLTGEKISIQTKTSQRVASQSFRFLLNSNGAITILSDPS